MGVKIVLGEMSGLKTSSGGVIEPHIGWRYSWVPLVVVAILGMFVEVYLTRNGPGVSGDAVHYMEGARNLLAGRGYSRLKADGTAYPITTFPPLFSLALAGAGLTGLPMEAAGRYLNSFLLGANCFLVGFLILRMTRSILFSVSGSLLALMSLNVIQIHSWVMSEPLFIFMALLALLAFTWYWQKKSRIALIATGLFSGMAILTCYIGLALPLAVGGVILFACRKPWKQRWIDLAILGGVIALPLGAWLIRNYSGADNLVNKDLVFHPISSTFINTFLAETSFWLFPNELYISWRPRVALFWVFAIVTLAFFLYRVFKNYSKGKDGEVTPADALVGVLTLFLPLYVVLIGLTALFLFAFGDASDMKRYLTPLFIAGIIWVCLIYSSLGRSEKAKKAIKGMVVVAACCLCVLYSVRTAAFIRDPGFAFGYTDTRNRMDEMVQALLAIDASRPILTNDYEFVYYITGRPPYTLPQEFDQTNLKTNENFDQDL